MTVIIYLRSNPVSFFLHLLIDMCGYEKGREKEITHTYTHTHTNTYTYTYTHTHRKTCFPLRRAIRFLFCRTKVNTTTLPWPVSLFEHPIFESEKDTFRPALDFLWPSLHVGAYINFVHPKSFILFYLVL